MRQTTIECPSGLAVTVRAYKVKDEDLVADPRSIKKGCAETDLLEAITVRIDEPGPYSFGEKVDWRRVLQGDRMVALLDNRIFTWGPDYEAREPCPKCRQPCENDIDLGDLPRKPLPETSREHAADPEANPFEVVLPTCKTAVQFRLLRGSDERALQKLQKQSKDSLSSSYLRFRVVGIAGVAGNEWKNWLGDLDGDDASFLRAAFDEHDCGVEQEIPFQCDSCYLTFHEDVRFTKDFLFPKYRGRTTTARS